MNRSLSRNLAVAATVLTLTFVTIPVASAQPSKAPALKAPLSLFEASLSWLGKLSGRAAEQADRNSRHKRKDNTWGGPITAYTGSCIDPDGNRIPCPGV